MLAFGHSILAMSGEETMAQVYREVESPKLPNFKKAAFVIFTYSLIMTAGISFLAVLLIPDEVRMKEYADNLLGGLAMHVVGPAWMRIALNALVVAAGFLILVGGGQYVDHRLQRRSQPRRRRRSASRPAAAAASASTGRRIASCMSSSACRYSPSSPAAETWCFWEKPMPSA